MQDTNSVHVLPFFLVFLLVVGLQAAQGHLNLTLSHVDGTHILMVLYYKLAVWWCGYVAACAWGMFLLEGAKRTTTPLARRTVLGVGTFGLWALLISVFTLIPSKYGDNWKLTVLPVVLVIVMSPVAVWCLEHLSRMLRRLKDVRPRIAFPLVLLATGFGSYVWFSLTLWLPRAYYSLHVLCGAGLVAGALWLSAVMGTPRLSSQTTRRGVALVLTLLALTCCSRRPAATEMNLLQKDLLVRNSLAKASNVLDLDGDGFGRNIFIVKGQDCDDTDATIHLRAREIPGNDVDENCFHGPLEALPAELTRDHYPAHALRSAADHDRPYNLLWLSVDALRHFPGHPRGVHAEAAPALAAWSQEAVAFTDFRTCSSYTSPSTRMMHTGQVNGFRREEALDISVFLKSKGYTTSMLSTVWDKERPGQGYDLYEHPPSDEQLVKDLSEQIGTLPEPFYAFTHLMALHFPHPPVGDCRPGDSPMARYLCLLTQTDAWLETLRQALVSSGRQDRTVVIVTGDHGEELGEHGGQGHADILCEHVRHVPLLIWVPGLEGVTRDTALNCFDLLATVLHAMNYPRLPDALGVSHLDGTAAPSVQWGALDYPMGEYGVQVSLRTLIIDRWKVLLDQKTSHLSFYDLANDPEERLPLSSAPPAIQDKLLTYLDGWLSLIESGKPE